MRYLVLTAIVLLFTQCDEGKNQETRPNVLIIQTDDLGWDDLGIHNNPYIETPSLDRLGQQSVQFNHFYVNPVCAPTRASLLTGRHFLKAGVSHVHGGKEYINLNETTIAEIFKKAGYNTGMWGKWHSGTGDGYMPWQRGFDEAYKAKLYRHRNSYGSLNGDSVGFDKWADEVLVDYAIDFMKTSQKANKPFLAYVSSLTCHEPLDAPDSLVTKYEKKGLSHNHAILYGMIDLLDQQMKRLFSFMHESGLEENTIIMFMSDNGPAIINRWITDEDREKRYINNYKGHKGNIWENGVKSPLFIKYGNHFKSHYVNHVTDVTDILPTLADLCGINNVNIDFDGASFRAYLENPKPDSGIGNYSFNYANIGWPPTDKPWTPEGVHDEYRPVQNPKKLDYTRQIISITTDKYKLMRNPASYENTPELYDQMVLIDIQNDPKENNNIFNECPEVAKRLDNELRKWWNEVVNTPGAFKMPVFIIGNDSATYSEIAAKGPVDISPEVMVAYAWIYNFNKTSNFARYHIDVRTSGFYNAYLTHSKETGINKAVFSLNTDNNSVQHTLNEEGRTSLGKIKLSQNDQYLTLKLEDNKGAGTERIKFYGIELERID